MGMKTVFINGQPKQVKEQMRSDELAKLVNKNPESNTVATIDSNGMTKIIPKGQTINVADGQELQTQIDGVGGDA